MEDVARRSDSEPNRRAPEEVGAGARVAADRSLGPRLVYVSRRLLGARYRGANLVGPDRFYSLDGYRGVRVRTRPTYE